MLRRLPILPFLLICFFSFSSIANSLTTTKHPDQSTALAERWKWGLQQRNQFKEVWIGYSISQEMYENEIVGSWYSDKQKFPTILEVLTGKKQSVQQRPSHKDVQIFAKEQLTRIQEKDKGPGKLTTKELAILFGFKGPLDRIEVSMLDLQFDFRGRSLIWLGAASAQESLNFLRNMYEQESKTNFKEDLLTCIGVHRSPALVVPILEKVLKSNTHEDLRAKAAFWLGQQNHPSALKVLTETLQSETSGEVIEDGLVGMSDMTLPEAANQMKGWTKKNYSRKLREGAIFWLGQGEFPGTLPLLEKIAMGETDAEIVEKAIFSMSEMEKTPGVTETLIRIAHNQPTREGRKQAIFWLSQNYTEKLEVTLKDFATKDPDREVRKHALFALAELEDGQGISELIKIAKTDKDIEMRKQAIFWLGESDDERAQKALLQIIEE
jgi:HEAT repeat protein